MHSHLAELRGRICARGEARSTGKKIIDETEVAWREIAKINTEICINNVREEVARLKHNGSGNPTASLR